MTTLSMPLKTVREASVEQAATSRIVGRQAVGLAVLLILTLMAGGLLTSYEALLNANGTILIAFILMSVWHAYALVRADAYNVWMPVTLYILSSALFIGFGPLAYNFGNEGTKTYLALRAVNAAPPDLIRATTLSLTGVLGVTVGMFVIFATRSRAAVEKLKGRTPVLFSAQFLATVFVIAGLFFKYALIYPSRWGLISLTIPGALNQLGALAAIGFGLWVYFSARRGGLLLLMCLIVWFIDLALTTLAFSKRELVLAMVFPLAGYYLAKRNIVISIVLALCVIGIYSLSQPLVNYGRNTGVDENTENGFRDRANIVLEYITEKPYIQEHSRYYGSQRWWTRFEFSAKQAFGMHLHDIGQSSHSLQELPIVFIPRFIWPDKPIVRGPGRDFYFLVTGRDNNLMSMTVYGDLYWQFGWLGVVLVTPLIGAAIAIMTKILLPEIRNQNFVYFPAALISMQMTLTGPTKYLINGFLTSIPLFVLYLFAIRALSAHVLAMRPQMTAPRQTAA